MKQKQVIGNWKMHGTCADVKNFLSSLLVSLPMPGVVVKLALPSPFLFVAMQELCGTRSLQIGAQNLHQEEEGAFTGEISASMLADVGACFTLVGHSERRAFFAETNALIQKKIRQALNFHLDVVLCVGENLAERESGVFKEILEKQIAEALKGVTLEEMDFVTLAYEPVWAIGTGKSASPEIAEETHYFCRSVIEKLYGSLVASKISILYGGSVKPDNVAALLQKKNIDGVLVGGASLHVESFLEIIKAS